MRPITPFFCLPFFCLSAAVAASFEKEIRPLLQKHCIECHGAKKQKGELRLDAKAFAFKGGHDGPAIVAGKADASPMFRRITSTDDDERMPPEGEALTPAQVATVKAWIESGAVWPESEADKAAATDKRGGHWSVQPLKVASALAEPFGFKPEQLSIDAFINASLSAKGLAMSPEADRRTLIRRLSFDFTGLPPAPERVAQQPPLRLEAQIARGAGRQRRSASRRGARTEGQTNSFPANAPCRSGTRVSS